MAKLIHASRCMLLFAYISYTFYNTCKLRHRIIQKNNKNIFTFEMLSASICPCLDLFLFEPAVPDHFLPWYFPSYKYWSPLMLTTVIKCFLKINEYFYCHCDLLQLFQCFRQEIFHFHLGANLTSVVLVGKCTWFLTRAFQNVTLLICWIMKSKLFHKKRCNYTACNTQINWLNVTL